MAQTLSATHANVGFIVQLPEQSGTRCAINGYDGVDMFACVAETVLTLHEDGLARLDQVLLGLSPVSELPTAEVYADAEGTPVATREGDQIRPLKPSRWQQPDPQTSAPVVVAIADQVPVGALPSPDAILLLPAGG